MERGQLPGQLEMTRVRGSSTGLWIVEETQTDLVGRGGSVSSARQATKDEREINRAQCATRRGKRATRLRMAERYSMSCIVAHTGVRPCILGPPAELLSIFNLQVHNPISHGDGL